MCDSNNAQYKNVASIHPDVHTKNKLKTQSYKGKVALERN